MSDSGADKEPEAPPSPPATVAVMAQVVVVRRPPDRLIALGWQILGLLATILVAAMLIFFILELVPLPEPLARQSFFAWLGGMLVFDFGRAPAGPIGPILTERLAVTVPLVLLAIIPAFLIGPPLGVLAGRKPLGIADRIVSAVTLVGTSFASIWLAMLFVLIFALVLHLLPPGGFVPWLETPVGAVASLLLPALALAVPLAASLALSTRDALVVALSAPMVRTAQAMGQTEREILVSALRNAAVAVAGTLGLQAALLVPASVIAENVFYLPGLGRMILTALAERDVPSLRAGLVALVALIALCRLGARWLEIWADPRLRGMP